MSSSNVSNPIFEIKANEYKTKIYTPMLSGSGKKNLSFGSMSASDSSKISGGRFAYYSSTSKSGVFKFGPSKGGSEFETLSKIRREHVSGE